MYTVGSDDSNLSVQKGKFEGFRTIKEGRGKGK